MKQGSLNDDELAFVDNLLMEHGNDDSILSMSELDGFFTALVSGPEMVAPSKWYPEIWGGAGNEPEWESESQLQKFMGLLMQHMNDVVSALMEYPDRFVALFQVNSQDHSDYIVEDWCFGYMHGVVLGNWPELSAPQSSWLGVIILHGTEDNFDILDGMSLEERRQSATEIEPAALKLHQYFLAQRTPPIAANTKPKFNNPITPISGAPKVGRNEPCPCGSGKKYKQCCLH